MSDRELPILVDLHQNVYFDGESSEVVILDRRKLPKEITFHRCGNYEEVARAIEKMVTQSLGVSPAGGYGVVIAAHNAPRNSRDEIKEYISKAIERIKNTRPTQTSLHQLMDEMWDLAEKTIDEDGNLFETMRDKAYDWTENLMEVSRKLGKYTSEIIEEGDTILTHCYGGPAIYLTGDFARREGKQIDYFCTETRPYLQGARLTSFALKQGGFEVTLITDGMPAYCMQRGIINKFVTGCDRVAMNGGVANKIGTYQIALAADEYEVPFYALSYTGPDKDTFTCSDVEVEKRDPEELLHFMGNRVSPEGIKAFYPAFDCTPPNLVEGIATDRGIFEPERVGEYSEK